jgi:molybdopterin synthase sulfur carrier subunit
MATVYIPVQLRELAGSAAQVEVEAKNVREVVASLEERFPGIRARLCTGDVLSPSLQVSIDGVMTTRGMVAKVGPTSEVHFLPALGGG